MARVSLDELADLNRAALRLNGYTEVETETILPVLLYAQLRGNHQSILQFVGPGMRRGEQAGEIEVVRETTLSALLDGRRNSGILVMLHATGIAVAKARAHGFGIAGTRNTDLSTAAVGYYAQRIAREGFIGFACSRSTRAVAPFGSYRPIFGTNPIAVGLPGEREPLVLDMATSAAPFFRLAEARFFGESLPGDLAFDANGQPAVDPEAALGGALRSMDRGPKGSGLALVVETLAGPLLGAGYADRPGAENNWGNLVAALDPDLLAGRTAFTAGMEDLKQAVRACPPLPGEDAIFLPGERGDRKAQQCLEDGFADLPDALYAAFARVARG
jgi:L-2-hydroxycarboxylate dehydrogenase (NAD+)